MARNYFIYIALFLTVLITFGSLSSVSSAGVIKIHFSDKIIHTSAYLLLTLAWLFSLKISKNVKSLWSFITIAFIVFVYGILIEVLQGAITNTRQADIYDILANFIGVLVALLVFVKVFQKKNE